MNDDPFVSSMHNILLCKLYLSRSLPLLNVYFHYSKKKYQTLSTKNIKYKLAIGVFSLKVCFLFHSHYYIFHSLILHLLVDTSIYKINIITHQLNITLNMGKNIHENRYI